MTGRLPEQERFIEGSRSGLPPVTGRGSERFSWKRLVGTMGLSYLTTLTAMAALTIDGAALVGRPPETVIQYLTNQNSVDNWIVGGVIGSGMCLGLALGMHVTAIIGTRFTDPSLDFRIADLYRRR